MWSVYHHGFFLPTLRRSVADSVNRGLGPIPLDQALEIIVTADDDLHVHRRIRALEILARAGLANTSRLEKLRSLATAANNDLWLKQLNAVEVGLEKICVSVRADWAILKFLPPERVPRFLTELMAAETPSCQVTDTTCETCYDPVDPLTGRPLTTITIRAKMSRTPTDLAAVFDPRSWGRCFDSFTTERRRDKVGGVYPPFGTDKDPIGQPWDPLSVPHLFFEEVTLETGMANPNVFQNILRIVNFTVTATQARLEFDLRESLRLELPGIPISMNECVTIDRGHMQADDLGGGWSQVELVKQVQYVDLSLSGGNDPLGLEPGELLNYYAPAVLCLWLEDATKGAVCCRP
jgi:hypothetical protein